MNFISHTKKEIIEALKKGKKVYALDTDIGQDDHLIGDYDECLRDVLFYFELNELPDTWTLELVSKDNIVYYEDLE